MKNQKKSPKPQTLKVAVRSHPAFQASYLLLLYCLVAFVKGRKIVQVDGEQALTAIEVKQVPPRKKVCICDCNPINLIGSSKKKACNCHLIRHFRLNKKDLLAIILTGKARSKTLWCLSTATTSWRAVCLACGTPRCHDESHLTHSTCL